MTSYAPPPQPMQVQGTTRVPLSRLVRVELRKAVDTLASFWLVVGIAILIFLVEAFILVAVLVEGSRSSPGDFALIASYLSAVALPVLAIMLVTTEWSQRTAMVTFSLEPRRGRVLLAKYLVCLLLTLAAVVLGVVVGFACALVCQVAQPDVTTWDLGGEFLGGFVVTQLIATTLGFAFACLLLNTPAAIVVFVLYRVIPVSAFGIVQGFFPGFEDVRPWVDFEFSQGPLYDWSISGASEWLQLLVSGALWLGLPLFFGLMRILRAEVK
ncbi:hypothetical protein GCM10023340_17810 [Nocardioides marinquilinus]|uniref:ABC transporter permease n=1 Tax=Nocardioides marinquilinus TaxID=1210400 RepID=A0ABP9PHD7_9ACTN